MKFIKAKEKVWVNMETVTFIEFFEEDVTVLHLPDSSMIMIDAEDTQALKKYLSQVQDNKMTAPINWKEREGGR